MDTSREKYPRLEALAMAIAHVNEAFTNPSSRAFKLKNPGLLRSFALVHQHESDKDGYRIFANFFNGYRALLSDLERKCTGNSRASVVKDGVRKKLDSESDLRDLMWTYKLWNDSGVKVCSNCGHETTVEGFVSNFFDVDVNAGTKLAFFLERG